MDHKQWLESTRTEFINRINDKERVEYISKFNIMCGETISERNLTIRILVLS